MGYSRNASIPPFGVDSREGTPTGKIFFRILSKVRTRLNRLENYAEVTF
jgi:hypothetical protein